MVRIRLEDRIQELIEHHGSVRAAARVLQVDHAYLWRLKEGEKAVPSDKLLRKMGLKRTVVVQYERL